ncbi:outer membrane lipoprotein chaperone LolA [Thalassotalea psychrophila]|uniref:Outer-membrane lipoprotein carrier protein n=1 Tax=Thalassotalea psychrophila TaxID=3065647 RepID=A0ABY9TP77_9GAMM|nr:outer membrane lipoprotein chaperone LolA [Colwelliaceae bacterium SQ149]
MSKLTFVTKLLPATLLALSFSFANAANSDAAVIDYKEVLKDKLNTVQGFSSSFTQDVVDADGNVLQNSKGTLAVKRPNLIYWETKAPDETLVVSDGKTLWFYNPFVEQVSAFNISNAVTNTPILLLSGLNDEAWQDYGVSKTTENEFRITSLNEDAQVKTLHLVFSGNDLIKFTVTDATGQLSHFNLSNVVSEPLPKDSMFIFTLPDGVDFDDQR